MGFFLLVYQFKCIAKLSMKGFSAVAHHGETTAFSPAMRDLLKPADLCRIVSAVYPFPLIFFWHICSC